MPTICEFAFDRPTPIYYSGEQLNGSVRLKTTKCMSIEDMTLNLVGCGEVQWAEKLKLPYVTHNDCTETDLNNVRIYHGIQEYLNKSLQLTGKTTMKAGVYENDFSFTVPEQSPATCKHVHGEVVYTLNLILKRKSKFNKTFKHRIVIKNRLDLNENAMRDERPFVFTAKDCDAKNTLKLMLPCTGFVPGQLFTYQLELSNKLDRHHKVLVNLCQYVTYKSMQPTQKTKELISILVSSEDSRTIAHTFTKQVRDGVLSIPLITPISTTNNKCLMQVAYYLEALLLSSKRKILQRLIVPIQIGTTPLKPSTAFINDDLTHFCYDNLASTAASENMPHQEELCCKCTALLQKPQETSSQMSIQTSNLDVAKLLPVK